MKGVSELCVDWGPSRLTGKVGILLLGQLVGRVNDAKLRVLEDLSRVVELLVRGRHDCQGQEASEEVRELAEDTEADERFDLNINKQSNFCDCLH